MRVTDMCFVRVIPLPTADNRVVAHIDFTQETPRIVYRVHLHANEWWPDHKFLESWLPITADMEDEQALVAALEEAYYKQKEEK